jgi:hypothetical protein
MTNTPEPPAVRPDLIQWQTDQSEWFNKTIVEIVGEYAEWRDKQEAALSASLAPTIRQRPPSTTGDRR